MNGGDAADQMVGYSLKAGEVVLRLSGSGAKNLAIYLTNLLKSSITSKGKVKLRKLIADGKALTVQKIDKAQIGAFNNEAKRYGVPFVVLKDKSSVDGICDIIVRVEDAPRVNRIFDKLKLTERGDITNIHETGNARDSVRGRIGYENPHPTRTREPPNPFERFSNRRVSPDNNRPSVRGRLRELSNARMTPNIPIPIKAPRGRAR